MNGKDASQTRTSRRQFLGRALGGWIVLSLLPVAKVFVEYLTPKKIVESVRESLKIASISDVPPGTARIFRFGKDPVILVHTDTGQFKAFNARCTHLGCVVQYQPDPTPHFYCNCHGSVYNSDGVNISGPAPRPLAPYKVTLEGSSIVVART